MKLHTNKSAWSELSMKMMDSGDVSDHPYATQFQTFFDALDGNREMPLTGLSDAMRTHEVIFAADASAKIGQPVYL
jgi:predicted dehydrogenase